MTNRLETYFAMTQPLIESKSFPERHIASRLAAFPLIGVEIAEFATQVFHLFSDNLTKAVTEVVWETKLFMETLKKVAKLFLGLLSTIVLGWWAPGWNHLIHEELELIRKISFPKYITVHIIHEPKLTLPLPSPVSTPIITTPITPEPSPIPTPKKLVALQQTPPSPTQLVPLPQTPPAIPTPTKLSVSPPMNLVTPTPKKIRTVKKISPPIQHMNLGPVSSQPVRYHSSSESVVSSCVTGFGALMYDPITTIQVLFFEFMMRLVVTH